MLTHDEAVVLARLACWGVLGWAVGWLASWVLGFALTRVSRKRAVRRMHKARKAEPK